MRIEIEWEREIYNINYNIIDITNPRTVKKVNDGKISTEYNPDLYRKALNDLLDSVEKHQFIDLRAG